MAKMLAAGGIVMIPLLLLSVVATTLAIERCWFWSRLIQKQQRLVNQVLQTYSSNPQVALTKLKQARHLPIARIFLAALSLDTPSEEEFRLGLESSAQSELPRLKRFQTIFETIVGVAPLLGLLGTVLGLIRVMSALDLGHSLATGATSDVTLGIGEALISTAAGLVVAIVTLLFANLFQGLYRRQRAFIQASGGALEILYRRHLRQSRPASPSSFRTLP